MRKQEDNQQLKASIEGFDNLSRFFSFINKAPILNNLNSLKQKVRTEMSLMRPMKDFPLGKKILDIGCGDCILAEHLINKGHEVACVDVVDLSLVESIKPIIYNGKNLPFDDQEFDTSLILFVLHHVPNPESVIKEALRTSRTLVVLEDLYTGLIQSKWTNFLDSFTNLEFEGHPHSNKTDKEWKELFSNLGLKVSDTKYWTDVPGWNHVAYYLERSESDL